MLLIREAQLQSLAENRYDGALQKLIPYLSSHYPEKCGMLGEQEIRGMVDLAVTNFHKHGSQDPILIVAYIELMLLFGKNFEERTDIGWDSQLESEQGFEIALCNFYDIGLRRRLTSSEVEG